MLVGFHKFVRYARARRARAHARRSSKEKKVQLYSGARAAARRIYLASGIRVAPSGPQLRTATIFSRSEKRGLLRDVPTQPSAIFRTRAQLCRKRQLVVWSIARTPIYQPAAGLQQPIFNRRMYFKALSASVLTLYGRRYDLCGLVPPLVPLSLKNKANG